MNDHLQLNSKVRRLEPQNIFVYGTLKEGYPNHYAYLQGAKKLGVAKLEGIMFHLGGFPAINLSEPLSTIHGEVYQVDWDDILAMDMLEGVDRGFYDRIEVKIPQYTKAWTYIMPYQRVMAHGYDEVIPSGLWRGRDTPKVKWAGWNKGFEIGTFETSPESSDEIRIGNGSSEFILKKNVHKGTYEITNKKTGEIIGAGYKHLGDRISQDGARKPIIRLPAKTVENKTVDDLVKAQVTANHYNPPPRTTPRPVTDKDYPVVVSNPPPVEEKIPNIARLLGMKVKQA
jgi:gamma-glutamylcyclotransferase (GGCT)/AIG2-like uncharacterized protein YtfP